MIRWTPVAAIAAVALGSLAPGGRAVAQEPLGVEAWPAAVADLIRGRIETTRESGAGHMAVGRDRIHSTTQLPRFYERRGFEPAWVDGAGPLALADSLVWAIERAVLEGLDPGDYHVRAIRDLLRDARAARRAGSRPEPARLAELDLLMTDAFLIYGAQLVGGRVDPVGLHPEWTASRREADLVAELEVALETGRIGEVLALLLPRHPGYARLRELLREYRELAAWGGWPAVPERTLRPGMRDPAVGALRERLRMTGELDPRATVPPGEENHFDDGLVPAVQRFQARHGLTVDGVVGARTRAALNVPVEDRIRRIELNLERWRWLPRELGARHVLVNIAGFELDLVEADTSIFNSRVMVGTYYRRTPVSSHRMTYLVLNPTWTLPPVILREDQLPLIRRDPSHLARSRIRVLRPDGREVDPAAIDWQAFDPDSPAGAPLHFRMDAGPGNPLGKVKFMFPNAHHVYLHDTPARAAFWEDERAFSSGCIRVERARELYDLLLRDDPGWDDRARADAWASTAERTVTLPRPVPVHLLYWTAWVDAAGVAQFRDDVYDRDPALDAALRAPPPSPVAGPAAGR